MHRRLLYRVALLSSIWQPTEGLSALSWDATAPHAQVPLHEHLESSVALDAVLQRIEHGQTVDRPHASETALHALLGAVNVMQDCYFETWMGTWPSAIDWTAAVMGTQVSGALAALTRSSLYEPLPAPFGSGASGNTVAGYFSHISSFYFGENAFSLRLQAYDDMLWVVLGWLEAIQFIRTHSDLHYGTGNNDTESAWFAKGFIPAFAHRARVFWDLAHKGWDTVLCGGGMVWNPRLTPYKNAITNELYIAASVSMYLHFPGDHNGLPFTQPRMQAPSDGDGPPALPPVPPHDKRYLHAAVTAYDWLMASEMTNTAGLFVDGFHIRGWRRGESNGTRNCDVRNEMVYTYNQGVVLTGQRGLWRATGNTSYLDDGHRLIAAVMRASGWRADGAHSPYWAGLGRSGVLEERCDAAGRCSQDGQTFKGIFFHHFAHFCAALPADGNGSVTHPAPPELQERHARRCASYAPWIARNARAAAGTRDQEGRFGEWWTPGLRGELSALSEHHDAMHSSWFVTPEAAPEAEAEEEQSEDYRNTDIPMSARWQLSPEEAVHLPGAAAVAMATNVDDPNRRGRGRTVETQSGGVAVLKALYMLVEHGREDEKI